MSRGHLTLTTGDPPDDAFRGVIAATATTAQDNGLLTLTINADLAAQIRPRGSTEQRLFIRTTAQLPEGEKTVWASEVVSWSHEESVFGGTQWTVVTDAGQGDGDFGPWGWEIQFQNAPPPGSGLVRCELGYDLPDGTIVFFPLWSGFTMESTRTEDPTAGHRMELTGMGGEAGVDRAVAEVDLPPNHGLTQGQVIRTILLALGLPDVRIKVGADLGTPRTNAFVIPCAEGWQEAQRCARSAGHDLYFDRENPPNARTMPVQGGVYP